MAISADNEVRVIRRATARLPVPTHRPQGVVLQCHPDPVLPVRDGNPFDHLWDTVQAAQRLHCLALYVRKIAKDGTGLFEKLRLA